MEKDSEKPLLEAMMLLQGVTLSCIDKKRFPFSKAQLNIFTALSSEGEMTMKRAARCLACSQEQATRAVAPLADAGYVERRTDPANRTRVYIRLTAEGANYLREVHSALGAALSERMEAVLSPEEQAAAVRDARSLAALFKRVRDG